MRVSIVSCSLVLMACSVAALGAGFTDGFESYGIGALDKNYAGPNAAPNGSGNPWFGPAPPNAQVVGTDSGVSPHSGSHMIRGAFVSGADLDQNWYNLAYRQNGGSAFTGNIRLDWYFYDPIGQNAGSTNFRDYAGIGFYNTAPGTTDYPGTGSLNSSTQIQRLGLGAMSLGNQTVYQARVVGDTGDIAGAAGWFNCGVARSVGWHKGTIIVGPALANNTNKVDFYIDDVFALGRTAPTTWGYNVIEFNTKFGSQTGYFDDVTFSVIPEPAGLLLIGLGGLVMLRRR